MANPIDVTRWEVTGQTNGEEEPVSVRVSASTREDAVELARRRFNMEVVAARLVDPPSSAGAAAIACFAAAGLLALFSVMFLATDVGPLAVLGFGLAQALVLLGLFLILVHALHRITRAINRLRESIDRLDRPHRP